MSGERVDGVHLYWLPLGAGGHSVRLNGRVYEALAARARAGGRSTFTTPLSRFGVAGALRDRDDTGS